MRADEPSSEFLDHLVVEFGDRGRRAGEFLRTAGALLSSPGMSPLPRHAECAAYCLREALKAIPESSGIGGGGEWRIRSRRVADAKRRFEQVRGLPGSDEAGALRDLLSSVDDLALTFEQEAIHQKRLIAVMVERTGAEPLAFGMEPVNTYQGIVARLDRALHNKVTLEAVTGLWEEALAILRQLFLPPEERHRELRLLAELESPAQAGVMALKPLLATPSHLQYFLARIRDPGWLELLDEAEMLQPLSGQSVWPVMAAVERLAGTHAARLSTLLTAMFVRWGDDPDKAHAIARAALELGAAGQDLILCSGRRHPAASGLAWLGIDAAQKADPADEFVQHAADQIMSSVISCGVKVYLRPLLDVYIEGVTAGNQAARVQTLCFKLAKAPERDHHLRDLMFLRGGSIADPMGPREDELFPSLVRALVETLRRASEFTPVPELLEEMSGLPADLRTRLRVWILGTWGGTTPGLLIGEVMHAISSRLPTGDDLRLVDTAVQNCEPDECARAWAAALGHPPEVIEAGAALAARDVPERWKRAWGWGALLPESATSEWAAVIAILTGAYGEATRSGLAQRPQAWVARGRSPVSEGDLGAMTPDDAARRIAAWRPDPAHRLIGPRELARTLERVVKSDAATWGATPLRTSAALREPMYVSHYLRGLATAEALNGVPVGELVDLVLLTSTNPWEATTIGDPTYDYDPDWRDAQLAAVDVVTALARKDLGFAERQEEIRVFLVNQARTTDQAGYEPDGDLPDEATGQRSSRALEAIFDVMGHEYRTQEAVSSWSLGFLSEIVALTGQDGGRFRAVIAPRLAFLRYVAPSWVNDHGSQLFGADAPDSLGQATVDQALSLGQPDCWLLEHFRQQVRDAVRRAINNALEHFLVAMLWRVPGYSVDEAVKFLHQLDRLPAAAQALGRLLRDEDASADHVAVAAQFWEKSILRGGADALAGFGWYAEISSLEDASWAQLTRQTLAATRGRIEWARRVADRAARPQPTPDTLEILNHLLRGLPDGWDRWHVLETARLTVRQTRYSQTGTPEYQRLRTTILERGIDLPAPDLEDDKDDLASRTD